MGEEEHEVFVFIKRKHGLPSAEKHPLAPPSLALREGLAYLSNGGREVGSRESNCGRMCAKVPTWSGLDPGYAEHHQNWASPPRLCVHFLHCLLPLGPNPLFLSSWPP